MAAGWLGSAGVSATEPARLLLTAGACGGRSPHACHGSGSFYSVLEAGLATVPVPLCSTAMQTPTVTDLTPLG